MTYVKFDQLPAGVVPVKDYRSLGATLIECHHDPENIVAILGAARRDAPWRDAPFCRVCRTVHPSRPVKMIAIVPSGQQGLF